MSERLERGRLLMAHDRPAQAEEELRAAVAEDPNDPFAHAWLALCLSSQEKRPAALAEAETAVSLGPDVAFAHYALASVLDDLDRLRDAQARVREAIRLDPEDVDARCLLSSLHLQRGEWPEALAAADEGLALDAEHGGCTNARAVALVQLGRRDEAASAVAGALARDPEDATTHANRGWALLHEGRAKEALGHFREALRLEPGHAWAQAGIVEALKARNFVYRGLLRWALWMSRFSPRTQVLLLVGFFVVSRVASGLAKSHPEWAPFLYPVVVAYVVFAWLSWVGDPLFNLILRVSREGRYALSPEQRRHSTVFGLMLAATIACGVAFLLAGGVGDDARTRLLVSTAFFGFLTIPLVSALSAAPGRRRLVLRLYTAALAVAGVASVVLVGTDLFGPLFGLFVWGFVAYTWLGSLLMVQRPG